MNRKSLQKESFVSLSTFKKPARIVLGILFMIASSFHFTASEVQLRLIPPFLPWRRAALYITGVLEFLGGLGLFIPRYQRLAGQRLALLIVAIFPANIYHTFKRKEFQGMTRSPFYHIVRWPMQGLLIWWALWASEKEE